MLEGLHCFSRSDCDGTGMVAPILEVEHGDGGTCSITGGPVYRGASLPQLRGHYFYSDYCGGISAAFSSQMVLQPSFETGPIRSESPVR